MNKKTLICLLAVIFGLMGTYLLYLAIPNIAYGLKPESPEGFQGFSKIIGTAEFVFAFLLLLLTYFLAKASKK